MYLDEKHLPSPVQLEPWRQVLLDAADRLERFGWFQNPRGLEECAVVAISNTNSAYRGMAWRGLEECAIVAISNTNSAYREMAWNKFGEFLGISAGQIAAWNDVPGRTAAEVTAAMRECARAS